MTNPTPTRAQAEAWMIANRWHHETRIGEYFQHACAWTDGNPESEHMYMTLSAVNDRPIDTIRAEMLAYRPCVSCKQTKNNFTDASVCDECLAEDSNRVEEQYILLSQPDHIVGGGNMADVVQPERFADDGKAMDAGTIKPVLNVAIKHDSDKTRYSLLPWEEIYRVRYEHNQRHLTADQACGEMDTLIWQEFTCWTGIAGYSMVALNRRLGGDSGRYLWAALRAVAEVFTSGAKTYGDDNWKRGLSETRRLDACRRHWAAYCCGEEMSEHGHHHLAHVLWYGLVGMWYDNQAKEGK